MWRNPKTLAYERPMLDIVSFVASLNPLSDSMARGIKDMRAAWQAGACSYFLP